MSFEFDYCCCCIDLRVGCLILGYLGLIGDIQMIVGFVVVFFFTVSKGYNEAQHANAAVIATSLIVLGFLILSLSFSIVLLVGLHKDKRGHVKAYLIFKLINYVLGIIFIIGVVIAMIKIGFKPENIPALIFSFLPSLLLSIYFLLVIRSYFLQMDDGKNRPTIYHTA